MLRQNLLADTVDARLNPPIRRTLLRSAPALAALALTTAIFAAPRQSTPPIPSTAAPEQSVSLAPASDSTSASGALQPSDNAVAQITPPIVIALSDPDYSYEARKKKISGTCLISFTVDAEGIPRTAHVVKSIEPSLDANAVQTIETWRFKPAMRNGNTPISFYLYGQSEFQAP